MKLLLNEERKFLNLLMLLHGQFLQKEGGKQFILYLLLFLQLHQLIKVLKMGVEVKILDYLFVGMLYLGLLILKGQVSFQIHQLRLV
jgi:hypothetical protein